MSSHFYNTIVHKLKGKPAVTVYVSSEHLLLFGLALRSCIVYTCLRLGLQTFKRLRSAFS